MLVFEGAEYCPNTAGQTFKEVKLLRSLAGAWLAMLGERVQWGTDFYFISSLAGDPLRTRSFDDQALQLFCLSPGMCGRQLFRGHS